MKPQLLVAVAGIPPEVGADFVAGFTKTAPIISWLPLNQSNCYTDSYSTSLYERLAVKLRRREQSIQSSLLSNANLVLLYLHKGDGSESALYEKFGSEALLAPIESPESVNKPLGTGNQRRQVINSLAREGNRALKHARTLLSVIAEEVTNRDNKTCLLLPRKNFGRDVEKVFQCVHHAVLERERKEEFEKN